MGRIGRKIKGFFKKVGRGLKKAGQAVYNKVIKPVYKKVIKPVVAKSGAALGTAAGAAIGSYAGNPEMGAKI